jgi:hypothetical protein
MRATGPAKAHARVRKADRQEENTIMRAILAAVIALSVLAGVAGTAFADDFPNDFWKQQERNLP